MKKYLAIFAVAALTLTSCQDFLVEAPVLTQSTELTLSDYNGLNKAVGGAYSPLADGTWYGAFLVLDSEMRAGNAMIPFNNSFTSGRMTTPYYMNYDPSSTSGLWSYAYYTISAVNNVLNVLEADNEIDADQADLNNLMAECYALRGLAHFDLLRTYCRTNGSNPSLGVPVITTPQLPSDMPARNTVEETYAQIISDLTKAQSIISADYARAGSDSKAFVTKDMITALLARVYLYHKDYQKAADCATAIINSGKYQLWSADEYASVWGEDTYKGGEVIFYVYGKKSNGYDEYWEGPSHMTNPKGYADCAASFQLVDLFEDGDVRGSKGVRGDADGTIMFGTDEDEASGGQYWTMKYFGKGEGDATSIPDVNNVIVLRLSEMYLIRAEAILNGASVSGVTALSDLNTIRAARNASVLTSAGAAAVALERRLELNFEGHLWFDLDRTGGSVSYSDGVVNRSIDANSPYWALPIPKSQIDIDENLEQNPGY